MRSVAFILFPKFSMIGLTGMLEPLRMANRYARQQEFSWRFVSADGDDVAASNGIPVSASENIAAMGPADIALFCASYDAESNLSAPVLAGVRKLARQGAMIGAVDMGQLVLASAGVLDGFDVSVHWEALPGFRETWSRVSFTQSSYVIDRNRMTAASSAAAMDMMLDYLSRTLGVQTSVYAAEQLGHRHLPGPLNEARLPPDVRYQVKHPRLVSILRAMEDNIEDALSTADLASAGGISVRHMERLFQRHLSIAPRNFYRRMRLERAALMLAYSEINVTTAATACGFNSLAEFSRAYKAEFGDTPTQHRKREIRSGLF